MRATCSEVSSAPAPAVPMPEGMGQQPFGTKDAARACRAQRYGIKPCPLSNTLGRSLCAVPVVWAFGPFTEAPSAASVKGHPKYSHS
jgi:hypothetical protein